MPVLDFDPQAKIELRGGNATLYQTRARVVLIEGRRGTAKTTSWCKKIIDRCAQYRGSRHLIVRQTRESLTDSSLVTLEKVIGERHPEVTRCGRSQRHNYNLFGSEIVVGGLDKPSKLYSTEWDTVVVEEAIETSQDAVEQFRACLRHFRTPYHQIILATNPGPPNHWLNQFATPCGDEIRNITDRASWHRCQEYNNGRQTGQARRIISTHQDNPSYWDWDKWCWSPVGEEYIGENLANLTGHRRGRFFDGRWVAAEGGVFPEFDVTKHVVAPFPIPQEWPQFIGMDFGRDHPCAVLWLAIGPAGTVYVVHEIHRSGMDIPQVSGYIREVNVGRNIVGRFCDPRDGFKRTMGQPTPIIQMLAEQGLGYFAKWPPAAKEAKVAQIENIRNYLIGGRLKVFNTCPMTIGEFQSWTYKRNARGEMPTGDDAYEDRNNDALDVLAGVLSSGLEQMASVHLSGAGLRADKVEVVRIGKQR